MSEKEVQIFKFSEDDRKLFRGLTKWIRFFSLMYLVMWLVLSVAIITSMWLIWGSN
jgi:hypothetical protein